MLRLLLLSAPVLSIEVGRKTRHEEQEEAGPSEEDARLIDVVGVDVLREGAHVVGAAVRARERHRRARPPARRTIVLALLYIYI